MQNISRIATDIFLLNIQTVAAANLEILDIVVHWPVLVLDQTIFLNSKLKTDIENGWLC